jgi:hypothetical protein
MPLGRFVIMYTHPPRMGGKRRGDNAEGKLRQGRASRRGRG